MLFWQISFNLVVFVPCLVAVIDKDPPIPLGQHQTASGFIEEVEFSPSSEDFYEKFMRRSTPVIMKGLASHWPASELWSNLSYLRETHGDTLFNVEQRKVFKNSHAIKNTMRLRDFLNTFEDSNVYLDSLISSGSGMLDDILMPAPLQCREISKGVSAVALLISSGGTSSAFHHDGYENLLTLVSGVKEILLYNKSYTGQLHGNDYNIVPGVSPIEPENVDMSKHGFIKGIPFWKGTLQAGDAIYIPRHWWHHVRSSGSPNIALSIWFTLFGLDDNLSQYNASDVLEEVKSYQHAMDQQPLKLACRNLARPLNQFLGVNPNDPSSLRYRIPKLNTRPDDVLLASGYAMPVLGLGTGGLNDSTIESVEYSLQVGYRMFDCAEVYSGSEEGVAVALQKSGIARSDVFIATKVAPSNLGYEPTLDAIENSLKRLNSTYIDLYYIHSKKCENCDKATGTWEDSWRAMEHAHRQGKLRSLGMSNVDVGDLEALALFATVPISAVQNWFDPFHQERSVRRYCQKHNIRFVGYSTLGHNWVSLGLEDNPIMSLELITDISSHYDYVASHVLLRWAVHENVTVIPRSSNRNHIAQNYRAMDIHLHPSEIKAIRKLEELVNEVLEEEETETSARHKEEL